MICCDSGIIIARCACSIEASVVDSAGDSNSKVLRLDFDRRPEEEYAMRETSDPHDPLGFIIIAVLGVMVILALHLI